MEPGQLTGQAFLPLRDDKFWLPKMMHRAQRHLLQTRDLAAAVCFPVAVIRENVYYRCALSCALSFHVR